MQRKGVCGGSWAVGEKGEFPSACAYSKYLQLGLGRLKVKPETVQLSYMIGRDPVIRTTTCSSLPGNELVEIWNY